MARLKKHADAVPDARNIHGRLVIKTWRGITVASAWPRPRGPSKKPSEIWWRGTFGTAAQMASRPYHLDQDFAVAWTENTKFRPEDILTAAALGKLYEFVDPTGTIKGNVLDVASNPQATLDLITTVPGSMLFRSPTGWIAVPPGNPGQVLEYAAADRIRWTNPTSASAGTAWTPADLAETTPDTAAEATKGILILPLTDAYINTVWSRIDRAAGATYQHALYRLNSLTIAEVMATAPIDTGGGTGPHRFVATFAPKVPILQGQRYALVVSRTDSSGAANPGANKSTTNLNDAGPWNFSINGLRLIKAVPQVGDTFTQSGDQIGINFGWST